MVYAQHAPYEILRTKLVDFETMQRVRRFSRYWDLIANSGNFRETVPVIFGEGSAFTAFMALSDWIYAESGKTHAIALGRLAEMIFRHLTEVRGQAPAEVAEVLWRDYQRVGRSDRPEYLRAYIADDRVPGKSATSGGKLSRQAKHLA
jgi:hypothetical protein